MAPLIPSAKATLSYPLYACDFDPTDSSRLVVGGGGGAGRTGVGNKITVLDTSKPDELVEAAEIELSKEEDNVTSLAVGQSPEKKTLVFAGVNSSPEQLEKGKNAHFRVFQVEAAAKKATKSNATGKISEVSRTSMFTKTEKDLYQRVTRLSRLYPGQSQLGAVATGLAKKSEIVIFDTAQSKSPTPKETIQVDKEPVDMDFVQTGTDEYLFAYCDEHDIYVKKLGSKDGEEKPECVYITPASRSHEKVTIPAFRALRWLTKDFILMLTNIHSRGGVVLQILRLPPSGKGQCRIAQSHRLPSNISKATGLAVSNLTPPVTPSSPQDYTQYVVAVAGHDISISLFKVDLQHINNVYMVAPIKPFRTFRNVHPLQITGIAFSLFTPPAHPITASTPPQSLKLASVGVSNTVIVHTLPLFPVPLSVKRGQSRTPRYVVALPSSKAIYSFGIILSILAALLTAIVFQSILEVRGMVKPQLGAANYLPLPLQEALGKPYVFPSDYQALQSASEVLPSPIPSAIPPSAPSPSFFSHLRGEGKLFVHHAPEEEVVKAVTHDEEVHGEGKEWEHLSEEQKEGWKEKLKTAGHWAEGMGEGIFKGVVFGELGALVGGVAAAAVGGV
ncbi:guanine nucleotide exchange factor protein [Rutstroemia sp. NJR-2017a WRK4]|nr:guanine nucleotide exchange factor protein [Rutstroemia sp. NJR-2017a WRK4]